ncbi:hypothetical protein CC1G_12122 [Coprinopsis cinerea okayama7|uniref:Uncharacterized protein n=1 Tax=Coprinopsis cinerea (strain Okayama-7 / 130 / ATCC MYA-4618 / FGSC 9003) TaxID=240176 RepID=A8PAX9_COPC7|nr:hypothetical protein CC1G_12122 [Coprinopsis cinerea okayama7\|eukprot:XP_001840068.2 hypothetical protein CC1G_12122 [Coprinopsis cinerea okayama7\
MAGIGYFSNSGNYHIFADQRTEEQIWADARAEIKAKNEAFIRKRDAARAKKKAEEEGRVKEGSDPAKGVQPGEVGSFGSASVNPETSRSGGDPSSGQPTNPSNRPPSILLSGSSPKDPPPPPASSASTSNHSGDQSQALGHVASDTTRLSATHTDTPPTSPTTISFADTAAKSSSGVSAPKPEKKSSLKNLFRTRRKSYQEKEDQNSLGS